MNPWLYPAYFLFAVIMAYANSQFGFFEAAVVVLLMLSAILCWKKRRPQDFKITKHIRVFLIPMFGLVFLTSYFLVRAIQPANYRAENLAGLAALSLFLAIYFGYLDKRLLR